MARGMRIGFGGGYMAAANGMLTMTGRSASFSTGKPWPAWRSAMAPFTWAHVGSNSINALNPRFNVALNPDYPNPTWRTHASVIDAWNGAVWVESALKLYFGPNGGHDDYWGNETYIWDAVTATWSMGMPPTGSIGHSPGIALVADGLENTGVYGDGRVRSYHTYSHLADRNGTPWFFGGVPCSLSGSGAGCRPWYWDSGTMDWHDNHGAIYSEMGPSSSGTCYDSRRDVFWEVPKSTPFYPRRYDPTSDTRVDLTYPITLEGAYSRPVYDSLRDMIVLFSGSRFKVAPLPMTEAGSVPTSITGTGPNSALQEYGRMGGPVYDAAQDRYLCWWNSTTIYVLTPPAVGQNPKTATWTWSSIPAASTNTVTPTNSPSTGCYGRFWYSDFLRCCGVVNATTDKMYVFAME